MCTNVLYCYKNLNCLPNFEADIYLRKLWTKLYFMSYLLYKTINQSARIGQHYSLCNLLDKATTYYHYVTIAKRSKTIPAIQCKLYSAKSNCRNPSFFWVMDTPGIFIIDVFMIISVCCILLCAVWLTLLWYIRVL